MWSSRQSLPRVRFCDWQTSGDCFVRCMSRKFTAHRHRVALAAPNKQRTVNKTLLIFTSARHQHQHCTNPLLRSCDFISTLKSISRRTASQLHRTSHLTSHCKQDRLRTIQAAIHLTTGSGNASSSQDPATKEACPLGHGRLRVWEAYKGA
jgi:hypothetical protein